MVETEDGKAIYMLLGSYLTQEDNATNRLLHGQFVSPVRDAMMHNRVVTFFHEDGSALATSLGIE